MSGSRKSGEKDCIDSRKTFAPKFLNPESAPEKYRNAMDSAGPLQLTRAQRLKCWHLRTTGDHFITSLARMPGPVAKLTARSIWGERIWRQYLIPKLDNGRELLFIHIPKCAGTSVATLFGRPSYDHFPAYAFQFTDERRFQSATRFAVVREPAERLVSILLHFRGSMFATSREREMSKMLAISEDNIDRLVQRLATDRAFGKYLFGETRPGLAGFNVSQTDWLYWKGRLLVDRVYAMSHMDQMVGWLSGLTKRDLRMPHANSSDRKGRLVLSDETRAIVNNRFSRDAALWAELQRRGGVLINE
jgi:hypothetical protein